MAFHCYALTPADLFRAHDSFQRLPWGFVLPACPLAPLVNKSHSARSITVAVQNERGAAEQASQFAAPSPRLYSKRLQNRNNLHDRNI